MMQTYKKTDPKSGLEPGLTNGSLRRRGVFSKKFLIPVGSLYFSPNFSLIWCLSSTSDRKFVDCFMNLIFDKLTMPDRFTCFLFHKNSLVLLSSIKNYKTFGLVSIAHLFVYKNRVTR